MEDNLADLGIVPRVLPAPDKIKQEKRMRPKGAILRVPWFVNKISAHPQLMGVFERQGWVCPKVS